MLRRQLQEIYDRRIQLALVRQALLQGLEFVDLGQPSEPEQVADFLKGRAVGQILDVVSAIGEHSLVTVDVANTGGGSDNPFQSFGGVQARNAGHSSSLAVRIDVGCSAAQKRRHRNPLLYANSEVVSKRTPGFVIGQFAPRSGLTRGLS